MPISIIAKRALGDITNRHATQPNTFLSKRSAASQKLSSQHSAPPKRSRQLPSKELISLENKGKPFTTGAKYIDIDASDKKNHIEGSDFAADIHNNHLNAEKRHLPRGDYLDCHPTVSKKMRAILVDWLTDVCASIKLSDSTLHLCVHILDRFLQEHQPTRNNLQLVGSVCLYIAAKYEEIYAPCAGDFVALAKGAFSRQDVIIMEAIVLNVLRFQVTTPYCLTFLARIEKTLLEKGVSEEVVQHISTMAHMFVELSMVDGLCLMFRPSLLAASAVFLAIQKLSVGTSWCESLAFHSGWSQGELVGCVKDLRDLVDMGDETSRRLTAIPRKFERKASDKRTF
ncbi:unnamed protein product [Agarophyton chilense]